jgi:hypothetical protein
MAMKQKELAIQRCSIFLSDRIENALATGNKNFVTKEAIKELLTGELQSLPDGAEVKTTW